MSDNIKIHTSNGFPLISFSISTFDSFTMATERKTRALTLEYFPRESYTLDKPSEELMGSNEPLHTYAFFIPGDVCNPSEAYSFGTMFRSGLEKEVYLDVLTLFFAGAQRLQCCDDEHWNFVVFQVDPIKPCQGVGWLFVLFEIIGAKKKFRRLAINRSHEEAKDEEKRIRNQRIAAEEERKAAEAARRARERRENGGNNAEGGGAPNEPIPRQESQYRDVHVSLQTFDEMGIAEGAYNVRKLQDSEFYKWGVKSFSQWITMRLWNVLSIGDMGELGDTITGGGKDKEVIGTRWMRLARLKNRVKAQNTLRTLMRCHEFKTLPLETEVACLFSLQVAIQHKQHSHGAANNPATGLPFANAQEEAAAFFSNYNPARPHDSYRLQFKLDDTYAKKVYRIPRDVIMKADFNRYRLPHVVPEVNYNSDGIKRIRTDLNRWLETSDDPRNVIGEQTEEEFLQQCVRDAGISQSQFDFITEENNLRAKADSKKYSREELLTMYSNKINPNVPNIGSSMVKFLKQWTSYLEDSPCKNFCVVPSASLEFDEDVDGWLNANVMTSLLLSLREVCHGTDNASLNVARILALTHDKSRRLGEDDRCRMNFFLTGKAATGKSWILKTVMKFDNVCVDSFAHITAKAFTVPETDTGSVVIRDEWPVSTFTSSGSNQLTQDDRIAMVLGSSSLCNTDQMANMKQMAVDDWGRNREMMFVDNGREKGDDSAFLRLVTMAGNMNEQWEVVDEPYQTRCISLFIAPPMGKRNDICIANQKRDPIMEMALAVQRKQLQKSWNRISLLQYNQGLLEAVHIMPFVNETLSRGMEQQIQKQSDRSGLTLASETRTLQRFSVICRSYTLRNAFIATFDYGLGGPDPTKEFEWKHLERILPLCVVNRATAAYVLEFYELFYRNLDYLAAKGILQCAFENQNSFANTDPNRFVTKKNFFPADCAESPTRRIKYLARMIQRNFQHCMKVDENAWVCTVARLSNTYIYPTATSTAAEKQPIFDNAQKLSSHSHSSSSSSSSSNNNASGPMLPYQPESSNPNRDLRIQLSFLKHGFESEDNQMLDLFCNIHQAEEYKWYRGRVKPESLYPAEGTLAKADNRPQQQSTMMDHLDISVRDALRRGIEPDLSLLSKLHAPLRTILERIPLLNSAQAMELESLKQKEIAVAKKLWATNIDYVRAEEKTYATLVGGYYSTHKDVEFLKNCLAQGILKPKDVYKLEIPGWSPQDIMEVIKKKCSSSSSSSSDEKKQESKTDENGALSLLSGTVELDIIDSHLHSLGLYHEDHYARPQNMKACLKAWTVMEKSLLAYIPHQSSMDGKTQLIKCLVDNMHRYAIYEKHAAVFNEDMSFRRLAWEASEHLNNRLCLLQWCVIPWVIWNDRSIEIEVNLLIENELDTIYEPLQRAFIEWEKMDDEINNSKKLLVHESELIPFFKKSEEYLQTLCNVYGNRMDEDVFRDIVTVLLSNGRCQHALRLKQKLLSRSMSIFHGNMEEDITNSYDMVDPSQQETKAPARVPNRAIAMDVVPVPPKFTRRLQNRDAQSTTMRHSSSSSSSSSPRPPPSPIPPSPLPVPSSPDRKVHYEESHPAQLTDYSDEGEKEMQDDFDVMNLSVTSEEGGVDTRPKEVRVGENMESFVASLQPSNSQIRRRSLWSMEDD